MRTSPKLGIISIDQNTQSTQQSSWLPPLFCNSISAVGTALGSWYQQAKETITSTLSVPEDPLFMRAHEDPDFMRFQAWKHELGSRLYQLKRDMTSGDINAVELGETLLLDQHPDLIRDRIQSPIFYAWQLSQLESQLREAAENFSQTGTTPHALILAADVIQKTLQQLRTILKADPDLAENDFYNDLINAVILYSGKQMSAENLQIVLSYYGQLIDNELHQNITDAVTTALADVKKTNISDVEDLFTYPPNHLIKGIIQDVNSAFEAHYAQEECVEHAEDSPKKAEANTSSNGFSRRLDHLLQTAIDGIQAGIQTIKAHPKSIVTAASTAALCYFYYSANTGHTTTLTTPQFPKWITPSWQTTNAFTNVFTNTATVFGLSYASFGREFAMPSTVGAGLASLFQGVSAQQAPVFFIKAIGVTSRFDYVTSITKAFNNDSFVITGETDNIGAGADDVYLAKFTFDGNLSWINTWGTTNFEYGNSVSATNDNGYVVAGRADKKPFLTKFDSNGTVIWARALPAVTSYLNRWNSAQQTTDNGYIVAGTTTVLGVGTADGLMIKFNETGDYEWGITIGVPGQENSMGGIVQTYDNGYIGLGRTRSFGPVDNIFLTKFNSTGSLDWMRVVQYGGSADLPAGIQTTKDNGFVIIGRSHSIGGNAIIAKFNQSGDYNWSRSLSRASQSDSFFANSVLQVRDDNYIIIGQSLEGVALIKLDSTGNLLWAKAINYAGSWGIGIAIAELEDNSLVIAGKVISGFGVGNGIFVGRVDENGEIIGCNMTRSINITVTPVSPAMIYTNSSVFTVQSISPSIAPLFDPSVPQAPVVNPICEFSPTSTSSSISTSTSSSISSISSFFSTRSSTNRRTQQTSSTQIVSSSNPIQSSILSASSDRITTKVKFNSDSTPGLNLILYISLGSIAVCVLGLLVAYLRWRKHNNEEVVWDDKIQLNSDDFSKGNLGNNEASFSTFFKAPQSEADEHCGETPSFVESESPYQRTPDNVRAPAVEESPYQKTPDRVTSMIISPSEDLDSVTSIVP